MTISRIAKLGAEGSNDGLEHGGGLELVVTGQSIDANDQRRIDMANSRGWSGSGPGQARPARKRNRVPRGPRCPGEISSVSRWSR